MNLTIQQRAILHRRHGITVTREVEGVAYCVTREGDRRQYAIEHLRHIVQPSIGERLMGFIGRAAA